MQPWVESYVGLEFGDHGRGPTYDCWGLVKTVLREQYGVTAPDFGTDYTHTEDRDTVVGAFGARATDEWVKVEDCQEGDVIILTIAGKPMHCGIVIGPRQMLHIRPSVGSCIESYDRPIWQRRIEGFYRHRSRV
jgi:cell wall-associated NlpC family hydrolase